MADFKKINYEDANITIYNTGELLECNNNIKGYGIQVVDA